MECEENKKSLFNIVFVSRKPESEFHSVEIRKVIVARYCTELEIKKEIEVLNKSYKKYLPESEVLFKDFNAEKDENGKYPIDFESYRAAIEKGIKNEEPGKYSLRVLDKEDRLFKHEFNEYCFYFTFSKVDFLENGKFGKDFFESDFLKDMDLEEYKKGMKD